MEEAKQITLTQGLFALIDSEDYDRLSKFKWCARFAKNSNTYYAVRNAKNANGKYVTILMHRYILGINDSCFFVDHKNHNGLCNLKANLRIATRSQNTCNSNKRWGISKYRGVHYNNKNKSWIAQITKDGKTKAIGSYKNEIDAAIAYNNAAKKLHGQFASLNLI